MRFMCHSHAWDAKRGEMKPRFCSLAKPGAFPQRGEFGQGTQHLTNASIPSNTLSRLTKRPYAFHMPFSFTRVLGTRNGVK